MFSFDTWSLSLRARALHTLGLGTTAGQEPRRAQGRPYHVGDAGGIDRAVGRRKIDTNSRTRLGRKPLADLSDTGAAYGQDV